MCLKALSDGGRHWRNVFHQQKAWTPRSGGKHVAQMMCAHAPLRSPISNAASQLTGSSRRELAIVWTDWTVRFSESRASPCDSFHYAINHPLSEGGSRQMQLWRSRAHPPAPVWRNGRRNGLKIRFRESGVWVRVPPPAIGIESCEAIR